MGRKKSVLTTNPHYQAFLNQKKGARRRGIGWELTFEQWLGWWGDDICRRGIGFDLLQMQRICDRGPYAIGNVVKGVPAQNSRTYSSMKRKRDADTAAAFREAKLNALMWEESAEDREERSEIDEMLGYATVDRFWGNFVVDKDA